MHRREAVLALALAATPLAVSAQRTEKMRRIGVLWSTAPTNQATQRDAAAMLDGLRERGWVEGKNLQVETRWSEGARSRSSSASSDDGTRDAADSRVRGIPRLDQRT